MTECRREESLGHALACLGHSPTKPLREASMKWWSRDVQRGWASWRGYLPGVPFHRDWQVDRFHMCQSEIPP